MVLNYFAEHRNGLQICSKIKPSMGCVGARFCAALSALSLGENHPISQYASALQEIVTI
jgi:hypothetical protein